MHKSFDGKVALVTGTSSGICLATTKAFAETGASVALADRREEKARAADSQPGQPAVGVAKAVQPHAHPVHQ